VWPPGSRGGPSLARGLQCNALCADPLGTGGMEECMGRTLGVRLGCDTASCLEIKLVGGLLCGREETKGPRTRPLASRLPTLPHPRRGKSSGK